MTDLAIEPLHLLEIHFQVLVPIHKLPHFHGPHWSALFRNLFHKLPPAANSTVTPYVWPIPIETGILSYAEEDNVTIGLVVPDSCRSPVVDILEQFNRTKHGKGHFQPDTLRLESVVSRLTGSLWQAASDSPLTISHLQSEIEQLCTLDTFTIETLSPLRIPRPAGKKELGHRWCDTDYFFSEASENPLTCLLSKVRGFAGKAHLSADGLTLAGGALTWQDISYGDSRGKTVGGVVGAFKVEGTPTRQQAERLVFGQYAGIGKNAAFGLGFIQIPELEESRTILALQRGTSLLTRALELQSLADARDRLKASSPGPDGMTLKDAKSAGSELLQTLRDKALKPKGSDPIALKHFQTPKKDGSYRSLYVQNFSERILHRSYADYVGTPIDGILSGSAYAYRRGLGRKNAAATLKRLLADGYQWGFKADITAFFDSVNTEDLCTLLRGFFPAEPLVEQIATWLTATGRQGVKGLPQGWSLSPLLSNLYLDRFDRAMESEGLRLVRFADDFVVLSRSAGDAETIMSKVTSSLERLGLQLKPEKTQELVKGVQLSFLGYIVSSEEVRNVDRPDTPAEEDWLPVFRPDWQHGLPVYLSSICRGAYSSGPHLIVRHADDSSEQLPWNRISRLMVVGRSPFSGGVVYRAMREQIPVTFIDIMGRTTGHLIPSEQNIKDLSEIQKAKIADPTWNLKLARELIAAKIHNCRVLLRRNRIAAPELKRLSDKAATALNLESLRGCEGAAARIYFSHFPELVEPFEFKGRVYRPPDGPVNAMLSFGYTLLYNRLATVLRDKGLDPRLGFFHAGRGNHCALASDLMEPLRHLSDRIVLSLIHLKELSADNFSAAQSRGIPSCRMDGNGFRTFITRYEKTMASVFTPRQGQKISYNAWLDESTDALVRAIKFDINFRALRID